MQMSIDSDVIRGHVDTIILKTLTTGEKYGYEIIKEIEQKSNGTYELKQPTLYSCLKRLESQGLISAFWKNSDIGGKRHYYKLTKKGRQTYENSMQDWFNSRSIIDNLMGTKPTSITIQDNNNSTPTAPDTLNSEPAFSNNQSEPTAQPAENQDDSFNLEQEKESAQMVLDEESNITQEVEPKNYTIEDIDEEDAKLLEDYYKTDERTFRSMTSVLNACRSYAESFDPEKSGNLLMLGGTGLGKTHLSSAIARRVIEGGFDVRYTTAINLFGDFETEQFGNRVPRGELTDAYFDCDLLILDDLGTELVNQFTVSCLYNLLNVRINRRLPILISTNLDQRALLDTYSERITSRLFGEFVPAVFSGVDVRRQKLVGKKA